MKKIFLVILMALVAGCSSFPIVGPPTENICTNPPPGFTAERSHICAVSKMVGLTPNDIDNILLDATAMAVITEQVKITQITEFLNKTKRFLIGPPGNITDGQCGGLSFEALLQYLDFETAQSKVIASVINRRIYLFRSNNIIQDFDCWMLHKAIEHQARQFGIILL